MSSNSRRGGGRRWKGGHKKGRDAFDFEQEGKKKRTHGVKDDVNENSPIIKAFRGYQEEMDAKNDRFERIMKLNRDITIDSKRLIFLLQRVNGSDDEDKVFSEAEEKMKELHTTKFLALAKELQDQEIYQFLKAFTGGLQEYIEAVTFYHYLRSQQLATVETIQSQMVFSVKDAQSAEETKDPKQPGKSTIEEKMTDLATSDASQPLKQSDKVPNKDNTDTVVSESESERQTGSANQSSSSGPQTQCEEVVPEPSQGSSLSSTLCVPIPPSEYMLGVADFTGELMRMAINSVGAGDLETPKLIADTMRVLFDAFSTLSNTSREMRRKTTVLRQSLAKVERACYTLQVRGSEIPNHMLADVFTSSAGPTDNFMSEDTDDLYA